jgi:hypothetical protein
MIGSSQAAFLHHHAGSLPDEVLGANLQGLISAFENNAVLRGIWRDGMRDAFAASFVEHIERKVAGLTRDHP